MSVVLDYVLKILFPDRCVGCKQLGVLLCPSCHANIRPYPNHGRVKGDHTLAWLDEVRVVSIFEQPIQEAIHVLKYQPMQRMSPILAELLVAYVQSHPISADVIIPVPLHPQRLAERGFNQSELLAQHFSKKTGIPVVTTGLIRNRNTKHQVRLQASERQKNMEGAFAWRSPTLPPPRILLLDDVLTTGATLGACAQTLRHAGAKEVRALALARSKPGM